MRINLNNVAAFKMLVVVTDVIEVMGCCMCVRVY